jgi:hypothetical protein
MWTYRQIHSGGTYCLHLQGSSENVRKLTVKRGLGDRMGYEGLADQSQEMRRR